VDPSRLTLLQHLAGRLPHAATMQAPHGADRGACGGRGGVAIVAVAGWDSCWHAESAALLNWLCGGAAPPDALAVVTATSAAVLAPAKAGRGGGRTCSSTDAPAGGSLQPAGGAAKDNEAAARAALADDPKVAAFRSLVAAAGAAAIAVPLGWEVAGGTLRRPAARELLGRWPLVQALQAVDGRPLEERFGVRACGSGRGTRRICLWRLRSGFRLHQRPNRVCWRGLSRPVVSNADGIERARLAGRNPGATLAPSLRASTRAGAARRHRRSAPTDGHRGRPRRARPAGAAHARAAPSVGGDARSDFQGVACGARRRAV
jgi:hypothetical protein